MASQVSEANGLQETLAGDQLRGDAHKTDHGQASVEFSARAWKPIRPLGRRVMGISRA